MRSLVHTAREAEKNPKAKKTRIRAEKSPAPWLGTKKPIRPQTTRARAMDTTAATRIDETAGLRKMARP